MRYFSAEEFLKIEGTEILGNSSASFKGLTYDSRKVNPENLFVAVKGEKSDGNDFIEDAFSKGASVVISSRKTMPPEGRALVFSQNPEKCVQLFASFLRDKFRGTVVGIVGSAGKTTTKDFCAKFLSSIDLTYSNEGNKNNLLGVPQTIVNADFEAKFWVIEMGISYLNEMDSLAPIVKPNIVLFTSIKPVHIEFMKSLENIFEEKSKVLNFMTKPSFYIYNKDDFYLNRLPLKFNIDNYSYGFSKESDLNFEVVENNGIKGFKVKFNFGKQSLTLNLPFINQANIYNFAAPFLLSLILSGEIKIAETVLPKLSPSPHRGTIHKLNSGAILYDDTYNSNPEAVKTLLNSSKNWGKEIIAVLGEMKELGSDEEMYHKEIGDFASQIVSTLICVGGVNAKTMYNSFKNCQKPCFYSENWKEAEEFLKSKIKSDSIVILKGSRAISLDQLAEKLIKELGEKQ